MTFSPLPLCLWPWQCDLHCQCSSSKWSKDLKKCPHIFCFLCGFSAIAVRSCSVYSKKKDMWNRAELFSPKSSDVWESPAKISKVIQLPINSWAVVSHWWGGEGGGFCYAARAKTYSKDLSGPKCQQCWASEILGQGKLQEVEIDKAPKRGSWWLTG